MQLEEISLTYTASVAPALEAMEQLKARISETDAVLAGMEASFSASGMRAGQGLADGIAGQENAVMRAANGVAQKAAQAIRDALQIRSPSRVTQGYGENFGLGFAEGILNGVPQAETAAEGMAQGAADALAAHAGDGTFMPETLLAQALAPEQDTGLHLPDFSAVLAAVPSAPRGTDAYTPAASSSDISLTLPLEIDGHQLAVVTLDQINKLSREAGHIGLTV